MPQPSGGRARSLIYNSILMSAAAIVMRAVGVGFGVWISNRVGAEVMGLYSLIMGVWGFALTLATSGINLATARTVAEAIGEGEELGGGTARAALRRALCYATVFGLAAAALLIFGGGYIGRQWLAEERTVLPLRLLGISLPAIAVSSALSGYFSAVRRVWKSAVSQLCEQAVKIVCVTRLIARLLPLGAEHCCTALVLGGVISEVASALVGYILYRLDLSAHMGRGRSRFGGRESTRRLLQNALPVSVSSYVRSALTTIEHILIPRGLQKYGAGRGEALAAYGMLNAMVMPVVMFPYAMINSVTGMLLPEMSAAASLGQRRRISYISARVWRLTLIFGIGAAGVFICFADELGQVLYGSSEASRLIRSLGPLMPVMYLDTVTDSMLKGLGEQVFTMNVNIADAALSAGLVALLVPALGIYGYIAVLYISELVNFGLSAARLLRICGIRPRIYRWVVAPLLSVIGATTTATLLFGVWHGAAGGAFCVTLPAALTLALHIIAALLLFLAFLYATGGIDSELCAWLISRTFGRESKRDAPPS